MGIRKNILEYFKITSESNPDRIAVIDGDKTITFHRLENMAISLGMQLIQTINGEKNKPIAVILPKSIESIIGNLAITLSCNIYMNLDIKSPTTRIKNILDLVKPIAVITNKKNSVQIIELNSKLPLIIIDEIDFSGISSRNIIEQRLESQIDTDPLCIINTSGSTGTPKGVVLNHRSFIDFTEWAIETLKISDNEIVGSLSPLVFDIYSFELCMLMAKGSTMVILPDSLAAFPANLLKIISEKHVSFIFWVPTIMVNIANMELLSKIPLPDLRTVWFAGEVFPTKQFNFWRKHLPTVKFVNLYGPIEITLDCTYFIVDREIKDNEPIPIGFPCRNTDILILNEQNKPVGRNEEGELCVRGTSLAMGYYNNPEKTASSFVQNPLNFSYPEVIYRTGDYVYVNNFGEIIFKGRKDSLIKHLGYRIELGEIEHIIINTLKLVANGCIVYDNFNKEIVFFYEAKEEIPIADKRKIISNVLPKYMIPNKFVKMDELPRNTNGKIDRYLLSLKASEL
jgi:amino acid adenylation domain-containing protein